MIQVKTYRCQDCPNTFESVSLLTAHTFRVHGRTGRTSVVRGIRFSLKEGPR